MAVNRYVIQPLQHGLVTNFPSLHTPGGYTPDIQNVKVDQHSIKSRFGLSTANRDLGSGLDVKNIILYQTIAGSRYTVYLTDTNICEKKTGASETWKYITETYVTGTVTNITTTVVTGSNTSWDTSGLAAGDKFILDTDHSTNIEEDSTWAEILTVDNATQITLTASYGGTTGGMSESYKGRLVYSIPLNERWSHAIVDDKLCFGNGNVNVQYWTGSGYATSLDSTYAVKARYMIEYANRLILGDYGVTRNPLGIRTSANGDPTKFSTEDTTAVDYDFLETDDVLSGFGKSGTYLVVFKRESVIVGSKTGKATDPLIFPTQRKGVGCIAPHSIAHGLGTCMFLGNNDFYYMDGNFPRQLSKDKARYKFFDIVSPTEAEKTFGFANLLENEIQWIANTSSGKFAFVLNLNNDEWTVFEYGVDIVGSGKGAK